MEGCRALLICLVLCYVGSLASGHNSCMPDVPCDNGECIGRKYWCDGWFDCTDGSDDKYCKIDSTDNKCDERLHFVCSNTKCVPRVLICDGIDDCKDGSDEKDCSESKVDANETDSAEQETISTTEPDISTTPEGQGQGSWLSKYFPTRSIAKTTPEPMPPQEHSVHSRPVYSPPSVDHYDGRLTENHNTYDRDTTYNREKVRHTSSPRTPGSDTAPTYYYPQYGQTYPRPEVPPNQNRGNQTPVTEPRYAPVDNRASSNARRHWPVIHQPRAVVHQRAPSGPVPRRKSRRRTPPLPAFHFEEDRAPSFGYRYGRAIRGAEEWLLKQRDPSLGWGEDTPRALVALSLIRNSFLSNVTEYDILRRRLKLDLGAKLLRIEEKPLTVPRLAMYINALLATCQDPRQIFGRDLVALLYSRTHDASGGIPPSPFALLTLCLTNASVSVEDLNFLENIVVKSTLTDDVSKDRFILSTSALACLHKNDASGNAFRSTLRTASRKLLEQQFDDGSFGTKYSTALAAQALFALDSNWNPDRTLDFLTRQQSDDGSFGDMLATYYTLPVLSGRSLVHLRNTQCDKVEDETSSEEHTETYPEEPSKTILYSLAVGYEQRDSIALHMTVHANANFFEIMQKAQRLHPRFRFRHAVSFKIVDVYSISGIPNDPERGTYWHLYVLDRRNQTVDTTQIYLGDIRKLIPEDSQELLYWYLPYKARYF